MIFSSISFSVTFSREREKWKFFDFRERSSGEKSIKIKREKKKRGTRQVSAPASKELKNSSQYFWTSLYYTYITKWPLYKKHFCVSALSFFFFFRLTIERAWTAWRVIHISPSSPREIGSVVKCLSLILTVILEKR